LRETCYLLGPPFDKLGRAAHDEVCDRAPRLTSLDSQRCRLTFSYTLILMSGFAQGPRRLEGVGDLSIFAGAAVRQARKSRSRCGL